VHSKLLQLQRIKTGDSRTRDRLLDELAALLTDDNVVEIIQSLSAQELGSPFGTAALDRWLELDAMQAARWIAACTPTDEHALLVARKLLQRSASPEVFCDQLPDSAWKQTLLAEAAREIVAQNPAEAIAFGQRMNPGASRNDVLQTVAYDWMTHDPSSATAWIVSTNDSILREQLLAVGAKAIAVTDPDMAAGWLTSAVKSEDLLTETARSVAEMWAARSPADAAKWVAQLTTEKTRVAGENVVLDDWIGSDPGAAIAWAQTLPEGDRLLDKWSADQASRDQPAADPQ